MLRGGLKTAPEGKGPVSQDETGTACLVEIPKIFRDMISRLDEMEQ